MVLALDVCHVTVTLFDCVKLPSHLKLPIELESPRWPVASKMSNPWLATVMKVPSCGAAIAAWLIATRPPAPVWLIATKLGLPGMWRPKCRLREPHVNVVAVARRAVGRDRDRLTGVKICSPQRVERGVRKSDRSK